MRISSNLLVATAAVSSFVGTLWSAWPSDALSPSPVATPPHRAVANATMPPVTPDSNPPSHDEPSAIREALAAQLHDDEAQQQAELIAATLEEMQAELQANHLAPQN
jgi:hypothetical protein